MKITVEKNIRDLKCEICGKEAVCQPKITEDKELVLCAECARNLGCELAALGHIMEPPPPEYSRVVPMEILAAASMEMLRRKLQGKIYALVEMIYKQNPEPAKPRLVVPSNN